MKNRISKSHVYWQLLVILVGCVCTSMKCMAQGTISFGNLVRIYDVDGKTPLTGSDFLAELYAAPPGGSLQPIVQSITPFLTGPGAGYFFNQTDVVVPGTTPGGSAVAKVVAWRAIDGATYADANHAGGHVGESQVFTVTALGGVGQPPSPYVVGMQSFSLYVVPEPSVLYLGLVGFGGLMLCRRWWRR